MVGKTENPPISKLLDVSQTEIKLLKVMLSELILDNRLNQTYSGQKRTPKFPFKLLYSSRENVTANVKTRNG